MEDFIKDMADFIGQNYAIFLDIEKERGYTTEEIENFLDIIENEKFYAEKR